MPTLIVNPTTVAPGEAVSVEGRGFESRQKITLQVDAGTTDFVFRADRAGTFKVGVQTGSQSTPGQHTINAYAWQRDGAGALLAAALFTIATAPAPEPTPEPTPAPSPTGYIVGDIMARPTSGAAWDRLVTASRVAASRANLSDQNDKGDTTMLAKALVAARTSDTTLKGQVVAMLKATVGTELPGDALGMVRELGAVCLSADLVGYREASFVEWVRKLQTWPNPDRGFTPKSVQETRPNNWGGHGGFARMCQSKYLGDEADYLRAVEVFKGWLGNRAAYAGFKWTAPMDWHSDPTKPVGINPRGQRYDGYLPDDARRGGLPPTLAGDGIMYTWEALQGYVMQAAIARRYGFDAFAYQDQALLRAFKAIDAVQHASGDDLGIPWVINRFYGTSYPTSAPPASKNFVGHDWLYGPG